MYNSPDLIFDSELTFLSYNQLINAEFTVSEILDSDLWKVTVLKDGVLYKCIPLFNCGVITSSNPKDIVLEGNKCLILRADDSTIIKAVSDDTGSIHYHSLQLYAFTPYSSLDLVDEVTVYCIVYDEYLNTLNNVAVNVLVDGDEVSQVLTDNQGVCKYTVSEACEIGFCYENEHASNTIQITGGE